MRGYPEVQRNDRGATTCDPQHLLARQYVEGVHLSPEAVDEIAARTSQQAWIRIDGGLVTWIFYGC